MDDGLLFGHDPTVERPRLSPLDQHFLNAFADAKLLTEEQVEGIEDRAWAAYDAEKEKQQHDQS